MPINVPDNAILLRCACHSMSHFARLIYEPADSRGNNLKGQSDDWYLSVMLDFDGLWLRLRTAIRYIFAPRSLDYGSTTEIVLHNEDIDQLIDFLVSKRQPTSSRID
jgi:hypothetical protein